MTLSMETAPNSPTNASAFEELERCPTLYCRDANFVRHRCTRGNAANGVRSRNTAVDGLSRREEKYAAVTCQTSPADSVAYAYRELAASAPRLDILADERTRGRKWTEL